MSKKSSPKVHFIKKKETIIFALIIFLIVIVAAIPAYFAIWSFKNNYNEKIIDREFHKDISQYPNVKTTKFTLRDGGSMVTLDIPEKGQVSFWYGVDRVPRIQSIGRYNTSFTCFNVDKNGKKVSYAYDTSLWLDATSPYAKWFTFKVNTIGDLINRYSDIETVLNTFPKNPELVDFNDSWGERQIVERSNPNFLLKPNNGQESPVCDLYINN